jgi:hypothetical protein
MEPDQGAVPAFRLGPSPWPALRTGRSPHPALHEGTRWLSDHRCNLAGEGRESGQLAHGELEERLELEGRELLRQMLQDYLDLQAQREPRLEAVVGADGVAGRSVETGHERGLLSVFGKVEVTRRAYRRRGHANLHPADSDLNLPVELHSHVMATLLCIVLFAVAQRYFIQGVVFSGFK